MMISFLCSTLLVEGSVFGAVGLVASAEVQRSCWVLHTFFFNHSSFSRLIQYVHNIYLSLE